MTGFAELAAHIQFQLFARRIASARNGGDCRRFRLSRHVGLADRNTLAGVVRGSRRRQASGHALFARRKRLVTQCGFEVIAYPRSRAAYGALSQCLTQANRRGRKGECLLTFDDVLGLARHAAFVLAGCAAYAGRADIRGKTGATRRRHAPCLYAAGAALRRG